MMIIQPVIHFKVGRFHHDPKKNPRCLPGLGGCLAGPGHPRRSTGRGEGRNGWGCGARRVGTRWIFFLVGFCHEIRVLTIRNWCIHQISPSFFRILSIGNGVFSFDLIVGIWFVWVVNGINLWESIEMGSLPWHLGLVWERVVLNDSMFGKELYFGASRGPGCFNLPSENMEWESRNMAVFHGDVCFPDARTRISVAVRRTRAARHCRNS